VDSAGRILARSDRLGYLTKLRITAIGVAALGFWATLGQSGGGAAVNWLP